MKDRPGEVSEWFKVPLSKSGVALWQPWVRIPPSPWRGAGVDDQARLESAWPVYRPVGSNPTLSALLSSSRGRKKQMERQISKEMASNRMPGFAGF